MGIKITDPNQQLLWLNSLIDTLSTDLKHQETNFQNEFTSLVGQINMSTDADTLKNITPNVNRFSKKMKTLGYDELSLDNYIGTKSYFFNDAKIAYDEG